jgi:hypothetical protein
MRLDESHPMNQLVLRYLRGRNRLRSKPEPIVFRDEHPDPYMGAGSHPDIVERVWDVLGASLPVDCRAIVYGTPALVHPREGVVFAVTYGTKYAIRVPSESIHEALKVGCRVEQKWTGGGMTNIEEELGRGWIFGGWVEEEKQWLTKAYENLESAA